MLAQLVSQLVRFDLVEPLVQGIERAVLADQLGRRLLANPRDTRDVVGRVALERLVVDHLAGHKLEPIGDLGDVVDDRVLDARAGGHQARLVADDLEHIEIARDDRRLEALRFGLDGQRPDDVVGLVAGQLIDGDPERFDDLADLRELIAQIVRHPLAGRLVVGELLVAERRSGQIEGDGEIVRLEILDAAQDDAAEAEYGIDELALRRREGRQREVSAVDEPVAVEQHEAFGGHGPSVAGDRRGSGRGRPMLRLAAPRWRDGALARGSRARQLGTKRRTRRRIRRSAIPTARSSADPATRRPWPPSDDAGLEISWSADPGRSGAVVRRAL